jgi:hypothetical protein
MVKKEYTQHEMTVQLFSITLFLWNFSLLLSELRLTLKKSVRDG